ncbi:MAG: hypothetical protein RMK84_15140 [Oscillochloridaceae bacterium]|nr:hypothetical protein [Chloroflexaceae bacterium]MDW8391458.1 hypothetical protein [Oscillochloridaceae bacterium]
MARIRRWLPRVLALLVAVELGMLSPLNCVIHCLIQRVLTERPAIAWFLCHAYGWRGALTNMTEPAAPALAPDAVSNLTPRALYELLHQLAPLLVVISMLAGLLVRRPPQGSPSLTFPPSTPPPRP